MRYRQFSPEFSGVFSYVSIETHSYLSRTSVAGGVGVREYFFQVKDSLLRQVQRFVPRTTRAGDARRFFSSLKLSSVTLEM